jgi:hypothetical protein
MINWDVVQDFIFQVNHPTVSVTLAEFGPINRSVKLQAVVRKKVIATLLPEGHPPLTTGEDFAAYCEVDISTTAPVDSTLILPAAQLGRLLGELSGYGAELASRGYRP